MVLSQAEATRLSGQTVPPLYLSSLTAAGTLFVYGADRWLERKALAQLANRHLGLPWVNVLFIIVIATLTLMALPHCTLPDFVWLGMLGVLGLLYLLTTIGRIPAVPALKECLGAACFAVLVWGRVASGFNLMMIGFYFMALSNFLWSSHQDRQRDAMNGIRSLSVRYPVFNIWLARVFALLACGLLLVPAPKSVFVITGLLLACWPKHQKASIDLTFLPLLAVPFLI